jgi:arsenate reductase (thioredoxin)
VSVVRKRILFLCIGNSCRSQMAEGFARSYGRDVIAPSSGGLSAAMTIDANTRKVMAEKNISLEEQAPKPFELVYVPGKVDLVINMSGVALRGALTCPVEVWPVSDPIGMPESVHRTVRDQIEALVVSLIARLRRDSGTFDQQPPRQRLRMRGV